MITPRRVRAAWFFAGLLVTCTAWAGSPIITFDVIPNRILGNPPFPIAAEASSGLPVGFTSTTAAVCTTASGLVTLLSAGTCSIEANSSGATSVTRSFTVSMAKVSGSFTAATGSPLMAGTNPETAAVGDFNGDGIPDLAVANNDGNNVTVLLGKSSGGFTAATGSPFAVGSAPDAVAVGDFNGDGKLDLAVVNQGGPNVTILLGNGSGGFTAATGSPFSVGTYPGSVAVGDFNGDGIQDLAVAANHDSFSTPGGITVLLGNGMGGFSEATDSPFTAGIGAGSVRVADFNKDGIQDLAVANEISSTVTVLLGNGSGGFTAAPGSPFSGPEEPLYMVVGDFNGDGAQDLATANFFGSLTVLLGNGSGGFTQAMGSPFQVGTSSIFVLAVGDFNGDGIADLAAAGEGSNNITVMLGNGSGGFAAALSSPWATGSDPVSIVVADFNRDGIEDLATANSNDNTVTVLLGLAVGSTSQTITFAPGNVTFGIAPYTIDATASSGLAVSFASITSSVCTVAGTTVTILAVGTCSIVASQAGNGTYAAAATVTQSFTVGKIQQTIVIGALGGQTVGVAPFSVAATASSGLTVTFASTTLPVCRVSGTTVTVLAAGTCSLAASQAGNADYAPATPVTQSFTVTGSPVPQTISFNTIPNRIFGVSPFVIDAASSSDLPIGIASTTPTVCKTSEDLVMLLGAGTCSIKASQPGSTGYLAATAVIRSFTVNPAKPSSMFAPANGSPFTAGAVPYSVVEADFNRDGFPDLATANASGTVTVLLGSGSGGFTPATGSPFAVGSYAVSLAAGDFNGDGKPDLAVANLDDNTVTVLLGNGAGGFTPATGSPFAVGSRPQSVVVGDFNGDGLQDLATANDGSSDITVLLGDGTGGFTPAPGSPFTDVGVSVIAVGDVNGDGIQDLVNANGTVLLGDGSGGFTPPAGAPLATGNAVVVGDFNGDGMQDLAVANTYGGSTVTVLLGNGSGGFTVAAGSPFAVGTNPYALVVADFNGDGIQDLATANDGSNNVSVVLGNGSGGFTAAPGGPFMVGSGPYSIVAADFNGDGIEDLATANLQGSNVTVLLGGTGATAQTITFAPLSGVNYGVPPFTIGATTSSGLAVSFASSASAVCTVSANTVTIVGTGTCSIVASQAGNATYAAAMPVTRSFTVSSVMASQTITFGLLADQTLASTPPLLSATSTSGLGVTFSSNTLPVCTLSGVNITLVSAGVCSITASQNGNFNYLAATPVTQTFTVSGTGIQPVAAFLDQNGAPALTFNGSTSFPDAGGYLIGAPGVAQDLKGNAYIVGLDSAGGVHLNSYSPGSSAWNGWQYSGGILDTSSGLSAAVAPNGIVWFTGRDIGNRFWINSWNGTSFGGWILVANGIFAHDSIPQIAIPSDGTIYVIGKDIGGRVWSNSYNPTNQTFTGWEDRQAVMIGQPSATAGQDGHVYVAVRSVSSNSPVYITQIPAQNAATANTWLNGGGEIDTDPQITSQDGTVYLLAEAAANTVYLLTFSEATQTWGTWTFTNGSLTDSTIAAAAGKVFVAGRDTSDRIYWYSATGNSWFLAGGAGISSTVLTGAK